MKRLIFLLIIAAFVIVGCGGGGGNADTPNGDTGDGGESAVVDTAMMPDDATDKGAITLDETVEDEIADENDKHSYTLTVAEGDVLELKINAAGSSFYSPYIFLYDADGALVDSTDLEKTSRSDSVEITFEAAGDYTLIVQAYNGKGDEPYELTVKAAE